MNNLRATTKTHRRYMGVKPHHNLNQKRKSRLYLYLRKGYYRFLQMRGEPRQIALGLALGVFIGMSPFMGLHAVTAIFLAAFFKWNKVASAIGVLVSNPATAPFLYWFTYQVGEIFYSRKTPFNPADEFGVTAILEILKKTPEVLWVLTIGGVIVGLPMAFLTYWFSYNAITKYRKDIRQRISEKKERLVQRVKRKKTKSGKQTKEG